MPGAPPSANATICACRDQSRRWPCHCHPVSSFSQALCTGRILWERCTDLGRRTPPPVRKAGHGERLMATYKVLLTWPVLSVIRVFLDQGGILPHIGPAGGGARLRPAGIQISSLVRDAHLSTMIRPWDIPARLGSKNTGMSEPCAVCRQAAKSFFNGGGRTTTPPPPKKTGMMPARSGAAFPPPRPARFCIHEPFFWLFAGILPAWAPAACGE